MSVEFVEVVLVEEPDVAVARLGQRAAGPMTVVQRDAHAMLDRAGCSKALACSCDRAQQCEVTLAKG